MAAVDKRFANKKKAAPQKPKVYDRTVKLKTDTTTLIKHNLKTKKVKVTSTTVAGDRFPVKWHVVDVNSIEVETRGDQDVKFKIEEVLKDEKSLWQDIGDYSVRLVMSPRNVAFRYRRTSQMSLPLYSPEIGNVFGQSLSYGPMAPGLDFAFGFAGDDYIDRAIDRGWLITDDGQTSPALMSRTNEMNLEVNLEPFKGFKVQLTFNRTENSSKSVQFMYSGMPTTLSGSYTKTHCALLTALRSSSAKDGYKSAAFDQMLANIPIIRDRVESQYMGRDYPTTGFMEGNLHAGRPFNPEVGAVSRTSSDVLIPAFLAAYTGMDASSVYLNPFPSFSAVLPNWRITFDGLINMGNMRSIFKTFTLSHAYQCTYAVGSYSSFLNWVGVDGNLGFTLDALTGEPIPSSPFNISSVAITEKFAPLIGLNATMNNGVQFNAEYRDQRTLTLNSSAGQVVEASQRALTFGAGYKIVGFNTILKMKGSGQGVSNDLTLNLDFSLQNNQALIRRIEENYTQPTSGARTLAINFTANYVLSKRLTIAGYFSHQVNTPIVTTSSYPTSNSAFGLPFNLSLSR